MRRDPRPPFRGHQHRAPAARTQPPAPVQPAPMLYGLARPRNGERRGGLRGMAARGVNLDMRP